jgi:hypothetical protein
VSFWANFWDVIGWFLWAFIFVAYLYALFAIIADLFRDRDLSGWWKAVWIVFLVFVPFLTALVYVIARGKGMAERASRDAARTQDAADAYIKRVAGTSPSDEIAKAAGLLEAGTISSAEYEQLKARALA